MNYAVQYNKLLDHNMTPNQAERKLEKVKAHIRKSPMITHVAIKQGEKVWSLPSPGRHSDVIHLMFQVNGHGLRGANTHGFLVEGGNFVDRLEAMILASESKQLIRYVDKLKFQGDMLFSTDIW